jgi:hypothetical protein
MTKPIQEVQVGDQIMNPNTQDILTVEEVVEEGGYCWFSAKTAPDAEYREEVGALEDFYIDRGYTVKD